jgi:pyroglutamyl-peptidase
MNMKQIKTILLTGFAPFDGETSNPSWEAVKCLDNFLVRDAQNNIDYHTKVAQLSCEFHTSIDELSTLIQQHQAEIVVCIGQAGGRVDFSIERVAINVDDARIPDNKGNQPIDQAIIENGPVAYFSSLPIKAIVKSLKEKGIPATVSQTAGTYVCNHVFYGLMHYSNKLTYLKQAGFIHIPYLPEQACKHANMPSMELDRMVNGLKLILETTVNNKIDVAYSAGTIC